MMAPGQTQELVLRGNQYTSRARLEAVENIEITMVELQDIMTQLTYMVAEQGEMIERIDQNVTDTLVHVEGAQSQLLQVLKSVSSDRSLILKMFAILIVFIVIFVVFFV